MAEPLVRGFVDRAPVGLIEAGSGGRFRAECQAVRNLDNLGQGITCTWPDGAGQFTIPPMLLIMLVENAFKHGVEPLDQAVAVSVDVNLAGPRLGFSCTNTPLPGARGGEPSGLGLANLRRRLELLFGEGFRLTSAPEGDCWVARLECDLRPC